MFIFNVSTSAMCRLVLSLLILTNSGARADLTAAEAYKGAVNISTVVDWPQYEVQMRSMIQCATLAKNTNGCQMCCYNKNQKNCVIITEGLEHSTGPQTDDWTCMFYGEENATNFAFDTVLEQKPRSGTRTTRYKFHN